ncbi:IS3 family transposase [Streptomyces sp. NPDC058741]|uniref:IS3 family transposase n=1 Tax=Streptomyces sp. NPDC058741 TaxID=3346620 RepID=UPI00369185CB
MVLKWVRGLLARCGLRDLHRRSERPSRPTAASFFAAELDRPHTLVAFIDEHRARFGGVEPICRVLTEHDCKIAPSTYYAHRKRLQAPSARTVRDAELKPLIQQIFEGNYRVYGARKVWRELRRQGHVVARCTVERLMREPGVTGAVRGKKIITTIPDSSVERAPDLLDRDFVAPAPNRCWVADFTHISTWSGVVYVAFVVDTFSRRIVGWSAATSKQTTLVLHALDMALWQRDRDEHPHRAGELIHHSDAGSQGGFNRSSQHLDSRASSAPAERGGRPRPRARRSRRSGRLSVPGTAGRSGRPPSPHGSTGTAHSPVVLFHEEGRRFFQDLDGLLLLTDLLAQPLELLAFGAGQLTGLTLAPVRLGPRYQPRRDSELIPSSRATAVTVCPRNRRARSRPA